MTRRRVGILIFPDVEVLDFCGPFEVFSVTRLDEERRRLDPSPYEVMLIAEQPGVVTATGGLKVVPDHTLQDCPALDVLVVPGGWGTRREMLNDQADRLAQGTGSSSCDTDLCLHRIAASGQSGITRRQTGDNALAGSRRDAKSVPENRFDPGSTCRGAWRRRNFCRHLGGHRHGTSGGSQAPRRSSRAVGRQIHGVSLP